MDPRISNLLDINLHYNSVIKENEISLLDILLNEVGSVINGKVRPTHLGFFRRIWLGIKLQLRPRVELNIIDEVKTATVIILVTEPTHLRQTIPVYYKLCSKIRLCFITNKYSLYNQLKSEDIPVFYFNAFYKVVSPLNLFSISVPIIGNVSDNTIKDLFLIRRPTIESTLKYFESIVNSDFLKAVIVGNDTTSEGRLLTKLAHKMSIKTFSIQHGLIINNWLNKIHLVDFYFLFGLSAKSVLLNAGLSEQQLVVSGAPYLEINQTNVKGKVLKKLNLTKNYILILLSGYGHGTSERHYNLVLDSLFSLAKEFPNKLFLVKPHRKEKIEDYKKHMNDTGNMLLVQNDQYGFTIFDWLNDADFVITGNSYTAIEAMYVNKPVISVDFLDEYQNIEFISKEAVIVTKKYNELLEIVKNIEPYYNRTVEARDKLLGHFFYRNSRAASDIIADFIYSKI